MALFDIALPQDSITAVDSVSGGLDAIKVVSDAAVVTELVAVQTLSLTIANARALNANEVRIDFSKNTVADEELSNPANYVITPLSPGAIAVVPSAVELPTGQPAPAFVTLLVNEMTNGAVYQVVTQGSIQAADGSPIDSVPASFAGIGDAPDLFLVLATDKNTAQVQFTEPMEDNSAIRDTNNYSFDLGLAVTAVAAVEGSIVTLTTSDQVEGQLYVLTVRGILAAAINDNVVMTELVAPPAPLPVNAVTADGIPVTADGAFVTNNP